MSTPPKLFDRDALLLRRHRVPEDADLFLHGIAAEEIHERLIGVNRSLTKAAIVCGLDQKWHENWPDAEILSDDETLEFQSKDYDLIIHGMCLHQANDPLGQLIQCQRRLKPDGLFVAAMFGGTTLANVRAALADSEAKHSSGISPRVSPMAEIRDLGGLLQRAGFTLPVADGFIQDVTYKDLAHLAQDLRQHAETNILAQRQKSFTPAAIPKNAQDHLGLPFTVPFEFIFLTGWCPHVDQPKPLRPGSAQVSLTDVLKAPKSNSGD